MEALVNEPPGGSLTEAPSTDMPPAGEPSVEASAVIEKPKAKGKWLPLEIQIMIIHLLDTPSYVEEHLEDNPADFFDLEGRPQGPEARRDLKNASLVCRAWHREVRPLLFRHLHLRFPTPTKPKNVDEQAVYEGTVSFLREQKKFLTTVVVSVTMSLTLPVFLEQRREEIERFSERMNTGEFTIVSAIKSDEICDSWEHSLIESLEAELADIRPRRVTVLATGAAMDVYLRCLDRYPISYGYTTHPRLQLLSISRRPPDAEADCDVGWGFTLLCRLVDADDLIVNDGSLLQDVILPYSYDREFRERDLHHILFDVLLEEHGPTHLKSLSFVSLFNFKRGLVPLSHHPPTVSQGDFLTTTAERLPVDIYSHRILPRNQNMEDILSKLFPDEPAQDRRTMRTGPSCGSTYRAFVDKVRGLTSYEMFSRRSMNWATAYQFQDVGTLGNAVQGSVIGARGWGERNADILQPAMGWFVSRHCLTDLEWRESEDEDKREVIEMVDREEWKAREHEEDMQEEAARNEYAEMREEELMNEQG